MVSWNLNKYRSGFIIGLVALFSLFALWIRLIPMYSMGNTDILTMVASDDPLYNLRQVELLLSNNMVYAWFEPMTLYPIGSSIYWGPLFPLIIAFSCIITGATTRPEIIGIALLIPPILGTLTVIVMYFVGKTCGDWKTGILAAGFTAIVSGQFFYRSFYGYIDHHIAEVLFSTIFCLFYMYALLSEKENRTNLADFATYKKTLLFAVLAGIAYLVGLFVMPTVILFGMIAGIFTIIQFVIDVWRSRTSEYLLILNTTVFTIAIFGLLAFGFKNPGMDLSAYTVGHIYAYVGMIAGTGFLYLVQKYLQGKSKVLFPAVLLGCAALVAIVLYLILPDLFTLLVYDLFAFFGQAPITNTVQEARGWTGEMAWITYNYGLLLMAGGVLVMAYKNFRDEHPEQVFALVWSLIMLVSTIQHVRYEYYLAINIALLSAVCLSFLLEQSGAARHLLPREHAHQGDVPPKETNMGSDDASGKKARKSPRKSPAQKVTNLPFIAVFLIAVVLGLLFVFSSTTLSFENAHSKAYQMNPDWKESLEWMEKNTPETGMDYYKVYDRSTFTYPPGSYGVMSWWDYGHMITYIAKRIPNANPFQQGVSGNTGAAAYFMSTSENTSNTILDTLGTRYIVTDVEMDSGKFWAMSTWYNATAATQPYQMALLTPGRDDPNYYETVTLNRQDYYLTTISRLHNFDGSLTYPTSNVYYVEYADPQITKVSYPVITDAVFMNASAARQAADAANLKARNGYHATVLSTSLVAPIDTVPAFQHYRLVHESPSNIFTTKAVDLKYVKIFEYVKGAHIKGNGIIEVPVITNTGRNFTYRQESINGEFIVPYSTTGNPYDVKATGKYTIVGTGRQYDVPESAVMEGTTIA